MLVELLIDFLSFSFVDAVFKQLLKTVPGNNSWNEKRELWLKEFLILAFLSAVYFFFTHTPYLLFLLTTATYVFTQVPLFFPERKNLPFCSNNCTGSKPCCCKIPGNVSFRSPLAKLPKTSSVVTRENSLFEKSVAAGNAVSTPKKRFSSLMGPSERLTPFALFKKGFINSAPLTSTPFDKRRSQIGPHSNNRWLCSNSVREWCHVVSRTLVRWFRRSLWIRYTTLFIRGVFSVPTRHKGVSTSPSLTALSAVRSLKVILLTCNLVEHPNQNSSEHEERVNVEAEYSSKDKKNFDQLLKELSEDSLLLKYNYFNNISIENTFKKLSNKTMLHDSLWFQTVIQTFSRCFETFYSNRDLPETALSQPFEIFMKLFLDKMDRVTKTVLDVREEAASQRLLSSMMAVAAQCYEYIDQCNGIFEGQFHLSLSKLSNARSIIRHIQNGGASLASSNFNVEVAETWFCSSCDSFAYNFKKFAVFDLDILITPSDQARNRKLITIEDCLHYYTLRRRNTFECVCVDEMQANKAAEEKYARNNNNYNGGGKNGLKSSPSPSGFNVESHNNSSRQVSFADEVVPECCSPSWDSSIKATSQKCSTVFDHYMQRYFSQLPKFLMFSLNRFEPDVPGGKAVKTVNQVLISRKDVDMYPFTLAPPSKSELPELEVVRDDYVYSLKAVIAHRGFTYDDGEYVTYLKVSLSPPATTTPSTVFDREDSRGKLDFSKRRHHIVEKESVWLKFEGFQVERVAISAELSSVFVRENAIMVIYERKSLSE